MKKVLIFVLCLALIIFAGCNKKVKQVDVINYPEEIKDYASATVYSTYYSSPTMFFSKPDINSDLICDKIHNLMVLEEKDGWFYGCCGNWFGWVEASEMEYNKYYFTIPLPEFLTKEHKLKFLRAYCMYSTYMTSNEFGIDLNCNKCLKKGKCLENAFDNYNEFEQVLKSLFTKDFIKSNNDRYTKHNGRLYVSDGYSSLITFKIEGYTLTKNTDDKIEFDVNFVRKTDIDEFRCSVPIVMVKTENGCIYDSFINGNDYMRLKDEFSDDVNLFSKM